MNKLRELVNDERGALVRTITTLKERMVSLFDPMKMADVNTVLKYIKGTSCFTLCEILKPKQVHETDPDEEIAADIEVIRKVQKSTELSRAEADHTISLMDDLLAAHGYLSTAAEHLSSWGKCVDPVTYRMILHVSIRLMIQLNILNDSWNP